jgi:hypothetical protein
MLYRVTVGAAETTEERAPGDEKAPGGRQPKKDKAY